MVRSFANVLVLLALTVWPVRASETLPAQLYDLIIETGMPHLEENLRYAVTHQQRCLALADLASAFPALQTPAVSDCTLQDEQRHGDLLSYTLICRAGHGTRGGALWYLGEHVIRGTLVVRLGGKNMTFYQRITARPVGACEATR